MRGSANHSLSPSERLCDVAEDVGQVPVVVLVVVPLAVLAVILLAALVYVLRRRQEGYAGSFRFLELVRNEGGDKE